MIGPKEESACSEINRILEEVDCYIYALACKHIPKQVTSPAARNLDAADLAQISRIKLWHALEKGSIINVRAYVRRIVFHEAINMVRTHKDTLPLPVHEENDFYLKQTCLVAKEEMQDPLYVIEQEEQLEECAQILAGAIEELPRRQRWAMMCKLKEHIGDILPIIAYMQRNGEDILTEGRPEGIKEVQRYTSLLSVSRKKLRSQLVETVRRT